MIEYVSVLTGLARGSDVTPLLDELGEEQWPGLLAAAFTHRLEGLLCDAVRRATLPVTSRRLFTKVRSALRVEAAARCQGYDEVLRAFADRGVDAVVVKGFMLSSLVYAEPHHRPFNDLDVLIRPADVDRAEQALTAAGFAQGEVGADGTLVPFTANRAEGYARELQHLAEFVKLASGGQRLSVDVHTRFHTVFDHAALDAEAMRAAAVTSTAFPGRHLGPIDVVVHLAYHAWWDTQSVDKVRSLSDLRLSHLGDIVRTMRVWDLGCAEVLARAGEVGGHAMATWALWLVEEVLGGLRGATEIDRELALWVDGRMADRWLQRSTEDTLLEWDRPGPERLFDGTRGARVLTLAWQQYFQPRLHRGDVLRWEERG